ncbi:19681_t:CDS:2, partial [Gigaspora rosea]
VCTESPNGMFSEDIFDTNIVKLDQLIIGLERTRISEIWRVISLDKKSAHFVVLYNDTAHLCTCLTLINRGLICCHFFSVMLVSKIAKFHIGLVPQHWYLDSLIESITTLENEPVIMVVSNEESNELESMVEVDFTYLENICGNHIFTKPISHEMRRRQQWGKGFSMLKKVLDLAIITNRSDELYEIHTNLIKEIESELEKSQSDNQLQEFTRSINNPIGIRPKAFNDTTNKNKRGRTFQESSNSAKLYCENNIAESEFISDIEEEKAESDGSEPES